MGGSLVSVCWTVVFILAVLISGLTRWSIRNLHLFLTTHCWLLVLWDLSPKTHAPEGGFFVYFVLGFFNSCSDFFWKCEWAMHDIPVGRGLTQARRSWVKTALQLLLSPSFGPLQNHSVKQLNTFPAIPAMIFSSSFIFTGPRVSSPIRIMRINTPCRVLHINFYTGSHLRLSFFFVINCKKCLDLDCEQFPSCYFKRAYYSCNEQA